MKHRLYFVAVNNRYGDQAYFPLVAGLLWGYAKQDPIVAATYDVPPGGMLYIKEPISRAIGRFAAPDVVAFSSYVWNHEWNKALARAIKQRWPHCVTVVGGVQVRDESSAVLEECEAFDYAIYGEGEGAFADFLSALYQHETELDVVGSLVWRSPTNRKLITVNPRNAPTLLEDIPSPYLTGLFDEITRNPHWKMMALQETNRGCAYRCSFCAWGASALDRVRKFPEERVIAEFEWFAYHRVELLYNCDANYGLFKRDVDLTIELVKTNRSRGYPKLFRAAYAKNSNDVVFEISRRLAEADMLKATTLALQSMDEQVLVNIQRKNINYGKLAELSKRYEDAGIATYAEIIVGLPGETYESFVAGLDALLDVGQHDGISIYLCMVLANTEMDRAAYRAAHGIVTAPMKALLYHGTPERGAVEEIQETVIATKAMPEADLRLAVLYGWMLQALHSFGLTQRIARRLRERGMPYSAFYGLLLDWVASTGGTVLADAMDSTAAMWFDAIGGAPWNTVDARFGEVMWPPEELIFLRIAVASDRFYDELTRVMGTADAAGLVAEQRALFIPPTPGKLVEYARDAVWYGRKGKGRALRLKA